jgi:hypothetical protein
MIQTAEEFIQDYLDVSNDFMDSMKEQLKQCSGFNFDNIPDFMIEFAKLHVQAALKEASEVYIKVEKKSQYGKYRKWQKVKDGEEVDLFNYHMQYSQDKKSIINSYPLEKIK